MNPETLLAGFVNNGVVLDRSKVKVDLFEKTGNAREPKSLFWTRLSVEMLGNPLGHLAGHRLILLG